MAYNTSKGPRGLGDILNEEDTDTQIDFGSDEITFKTNNIGRLTIANAHVSCSVNVSGSAFYGDGSNLTGLTPAAITTYNSAADNRVITSVNSTTVQGESGLTYDGADLVIVGNASASLGVTGSALYTATTTIDSAHVSSSLNVSGAAFYGDGSNLSNLPPSGIVWDGSTANGVATYKNGGEATVESNLTFDGTDLGVSDKIVHIGDTDTFINFTEDDINFQAGGVNFLDLTEDTQNEATFNEGGVDVDFRVESVNDTHMIFVDAANDAVSIGVSTDTPAAVLEIAGDAAQAKPTLTIDHAEDTNNAVNINADSITTAKALRISADALTTGNALYIDDASSNTGTRKTALIIQNNAAAINAQALAVQSDGGTTGIKLDKNYSDLTEASITGLHIDWDKTGASTSDNTMYGIQLDMDNTTATNGNNYMYGLHVTPTLSHAADAGGAFLYGVFINAQGGTNGSSLVQGARIEAGGGDVNYGIQLDVEDGGVDLRIESSADSGDYFQIQTTTHGATTISTVDDNATAAHLVFDVDGDITLDPAAGTVDVAGTLTASVNISASAFYGDGANLTNVATDATGSGGAGDIQFLRSTDGSFMSDGALSFSTGSSGATGTALSCSNLVVGYGLKLPYAVKTSNYSVAISDNIIYMSGSLTNITASLPAASTVDGSVFYIKNISAHREAEVRPNGSELIDNAALQSLEATEGIRIQALAAGGGAYTWAIIGVSMPLP